MTKDKHPPALEIRERPTGKTVLRVSNRGWPSGRGTWVLLGLCLLAGALGGLLAGALT